MSQRGRVAVVTGGNKGIGFAIVRGLCKQFDGDVFLTARNEDRGLKAVQELNEEGLYPKFHVLDVESVDSISKLAAFLKSEYGCLDVLVNNAGIAFKSDSEAPFSEQAQTTLRTNFTAMIDVCGALFPLLSPGARVVNVSSRSGLWSFQKCSQDVRSKLIDPNLTQDGLVSIMEQFVSSAQTGRHLDEGFSDSAYGMSKVGVTCLSFIQQRQMDKDDKQDILINACTPGYVSTDMTSHKGERSIDEGADTPLYLALLPAHATSPKGQFVGDRSIIPWQ